jgi:1-phosphofructokinase family hexose kinase
MILTVCPNTALDKIIFIDEWKTGTTIRTERVVPCVGGKGLNSAVVLHHLNVDSQSIGFFSGQIGKELLKVVNDYGFRVDPIWVDGNTRVSYVIAELKNKYHTHVITGELKVERKHITEFIRLFKIHLRNASYLICAGSLPKVIAKDFYYKLIKISNSIGVPSLIDTQGDFMKEAMKANPDIIKMNWEEFQTTFGLKIEFIHDLVTYAKSIYHDYELNNLVITLSEKGILTITKNNIYLTKIPFQEPVNAAGAGDAVSSALAWKLSGGYSWQEALKWAGAVSAASVVTERTGDVSLDKMRSILPKVEVEWYGLQ